MSTQTTTVYAVSGMTCGHCKASVTEEVSAVPGVSAVEVDLAAGTVAVSTDSGAAPDDDRIAKAVDEAGYEVTGRA
ncbi:heavy-metal-associated domain-containing protein [Streptomyces sp. A7024]|uniref:Heavy-metal-associated domain-containing protein n=1 Tax=Streptomyces coryli TaxID=1128680 RepID=A0A6G4UCQ0_9ACTN|nr:cation transporter [Streptomyces coryli]NGN69944.1 heavy-metal-associated domain-containing protein [Streptomyces coryli]